MVKKEKGITLVSLIMYIVAMTLIVVVIATISRSFYKNISQFGNSDSIELKVEKFNTFFLKQINTASTTVSSCNTTKIVFSDGTNYEYKNNAIYYGTSDKSLKLCDGVTDLKFEYRSADSTITVYFTTETEGKTFYYKKN